jgi:DNA-binding response OmpR family regulator
MLSPSITILNVDDHETSRYTKSRVLRRAGFEVKEAITGYQALQVVQQERPPIVLLDIHLPDIDGLEVCRRIKGDPNLASTLILQISASSVTSQDKVRGLEGGADIYLTEPVEPAELVAQVRALLRIYQAEQALARLNETLEQRVKERTVLLQLLHEILAAVNKMETVEEALHFTLDHICTYSGWPVGHVYWLNQHNPSELISSTFWYLDDPERFEPFRQATEVTTLARGVGLPGQVLASGELNWVVNVAQLHPQRAPAALQSGLQRGFGFPL